MKRKKAIDFLTAVLFFGILLSFLAYAGIGTLLHANEETESENRFREVFYGDGLIQSVGRYCDYRIFRHTNADHLLIGKENFIFSTYDEENGYDYLLDYVGGCAFTDAQMDRIAYSVAEERQRYAEVGTQYLVAVVPNSMTVCGEYVPDFLGKQSENTRLSVLSTRLAGEDAFLDLRPIMREMMQSEMPYNNTEDSVNAYGAFSVYHSVMMRLNERSQEAHEEIRLEDIAFSVRMTEGREAAKRAGLENIVQNRTVSLTDAMPRAYRTLRLRQTCVGTSRVEGAVHPSSCIVVEVSSEWDREQLMPFFSNSFDTVIYVPAGENVEEMARTYRPMAVIRILHEKELSNLLK